MPVGPSQVQLQMMSQNNVVPIDSEIDPVDIKVIKVDNIRYFDEMVDKGQKYLIMISQLEENIMKEKAEKAGISIAHNIPKNAGSKIKLA